MYKLPSRPNRQEEKNEVADFLELLCWKHETASIQEVVDYFKQVDDGNGSGSHAAEDESAEFLDEVMNEISRREDACADGYPFEQRREGTVLRCVDPEPGEKKFLIYLYLLSSTRLDMSKNRIHAEQDGTKLLEELSAGALRAYLGLENAESYVFGTGMSTSGRAGFEEKVEGLCRRIGEGEGYRSRGDAGSKMKDDKLDVVAWVPFADRYPGQLVLFAQCNTGTEWRNHVSELQPVSFVNKWMRQSFLVDPVMAYCISDSADRSRWEVDSLSAGLLFDRCRLVEYGADLSDDLWSRIRDWTLAVRNWVEP